MHAEEWTVAPILWQRRQMGSHLKHLAQGGQQRNCARIAPAYCPAGISQAQSQDGGVHLAGKLALCEDSVDVDFLQHTGYIVRNWNSTG